MPNKPDSAERRLVKVAAWFLNRGEPATTEQVYAAFPDDYRGSADTRERKWSRDKQDLKRLGFPLQIIDTGDEKHPAYLIEASTWRLPSMQFTPPEAAALLLASGAALRTPDHPLRQDLEVALQKLLVAARGLPPRAEIAAGDGADRPAPTKTRKWLDAIASAVEDRKRLRLDYWVPGRDEVTRRDVDPYGYAWRRGEWLLVGRCHLRKGVRVFYLRRVRALKAFGAEGAYALPADFDVRRWSRQEPWQYLAHEPVEAAVRFRGSLAKVAQKLVPGVRLALQADASRVARFPVRDLDGLARQALAWGAEAEILEPEAARERVRAMLAKVGGGDA